MRKIIFLSLSLFWWGSCYQANYPAEYRCSSDDPKCPEGYQCHGTRCVALDGFWDSGIDLHADRNILADTYRLSDGNTPDQPGTLPDRSLLSDWTLPLDKKITDQRLLVDLKKTDVKKPLPDKGCNVTATQVNPVADACLVPGTAFTIKFGNASFCNIGTAINSVGIFRFNVAGIPTTAKIQSIILTLAYAAKDGGCGGTCDSCDAIEQGGTLQLTYMRNDWPEAHVTWGYRSYNPPVGSSLDWDQAGAKGAGDRGKVVATVAHVAKQAVIFNSSTQPDILSEFGNWRSAQNEISFQVIPTNGAVFIAATKEQPGSGCSSTGYPKPRLEVKYCP